MTKYNEHVEVNQDQRESRHIFPMNVHNFLSVSVISQYVFGFFLNYYLGHLKEGKTNEAQFMIFTILHVAGIDMESLVNYEKILLLVNSSLLPDSVLSVMD